MKPTSNGGSRLRFGQIELDLSEEKLLRRGLPVRIENQPLQVLATLLEHPGTLVSREDLRARLWPNGTYVDFDEGLNSAVKKLRFALGDTPDNPIFIETIPRRGYRFIAPVEIVPGKAEPSMTVESIASDDADEPTHVVQLRPQAMPASPHSKLRWRSTWLIVVSITLGAVCWLLYRLAFPPALHVAQITRLTNSSRLDPWGNLASDGSRLFFLEREGDHWNTRQISVAGGESAPFGSSPRNTKIFAISTDQSQMLFAPFALRSLDLPLWSMPLVGGAPRRIADIVVNSATFSPDGSQIAFTNTNGVFVAARDGSAIRQLAGFPWCWDIDWSPNGKLLRFSQGSQHLWQVAPTGRDLKAFLPSWTAREGRWTHDGSYYLFNATKNGRDSIWAVRESPTFPGLIPTPAPLVSGPLSFGGALPSRDGRAIYAHGGLSEQFDVVRFTPVTHQFKPVLSDFNVAEVEFSPDGQWMVYTNRTELWRSRADGNDRRLLAGPPSIASISGARWSPDSKRVLFEGQNQGRSTIYLVSAEGGSPQPLFPGGPARRWPDWSPDGQTGVFAVEEVPGETSPEPGIYSFDTIRGSSELIPGARGFDQARLSPDGRFLAAVSDVPSAMKLLDLKTHRWSEVARGTLISFPVWSADSVLYFQDLLAPGEPVYRFQPGGSGAQRVYSFEDILQAGAVRCAFWGFAPDGSLLVQVNRGGGDLYALTVNLP